jgi:hypothetical protein
MEKAMEEANERSKAESKKMLITLARITLAVLSFIALLSLASLIVSIVAVTRGWLTNREEEETFPHTHRVFSFICKREGGIRRPFVRLFFVGGVAFMSQVSLR